MNTLICAGGTGTRVLEAVLHLCAAGLGPSELRILVIDPDRSNGNGDRTSSLVDRYRQGHELFAGQLGTDLPLFGTRLDLLEVRNSRGLAVWSPVSTTARLQGLLNTNLLGGTQMPNDLWELFFTKQELEMDLSEGFRARPSVGAAAMSMVGLQSEAWPWDLLLQKLENDLTQDTGARVFLTGSIFGGTGAASLFPIGRFLRDRLAGDRLRIAAAPLTPYFRFAETEASPQQERVTDAARSEDFPTHTRGAVDFYRHLDRNDDHPFDVLFWIGDSNPRSVEYAPGGGRQRNPAHVVELVAALASLEFFDNPTGKSGSCYAAAELLAGDGDDGRKAPVNWSDLPLIRRRHEQVRHSLTRFWLAGLVHLGFTGPLVRRQEIEQHPYLVPWYQDRFARHGETLTSDQNRDGLNLLDEFFGSFHFPWWRQLHEDDSVRLINSVALPNGSGPRLDRLANLTWPDRPGEADPEAIDRFYTDLASVPSRRGGTSGVSAYLALLGHAAERFIVREYQNLSEED